MAGRSRLLSQPPSKKATDIFPDAPEGLVDAADAFDGAQFRKDVAQLQRSLLPDLVYIRGSGELAGRAAFLQAYADPGLRFEPFIIRDRSFHTLGRDLAVVTADAEIRGTDDGVRFHDRFRYADTFLRTPQGWRVRFVQVSRLVQA